MRRRATGTLGRPQCPSPPWLLTPRTRADPERVDWDVDPAGAAFLAELNAGKNQEYSGPPIEEGLFERLIDRFEKAVEKDKVPPLATVEPLVAPLVTDATVTKVLYAWWVGRRKQLAMPLVRRLRPAPDPDDPDTTGVAFRPREKDPSRRHRSNNKKTFNMMVQLRDEFVRLRQILELIQRRERLKLSLHRTGGEYMEKAHQTLCNRLVRQRADPGARWKDDFEEPERRPHRKVDSALRPQNKEQRSHKRKHHGATGRPPKETGGLGALSRDRSHRSRQHDDSRMRVGGRRGEMRAEVEEVDSEEEAFSQLLLSVDTTQRDALERHLPRHLRKVGVQASAEDAAAGSSAVPPSGEAAADGAVISTDGESARSAQALAARGALPGGRARGFARIGRGGRVLFDRGGGGGRRYRPVCWALPGHDAENAAEPSASSPATSQRSNAHQNAVLQHMFQTGRACPQPMLEQHLDPDEAWRQGRPLKIVNGPLLFDFNWLPKPDFSACATPATIEGEVPASPASGGRKRKAAELSEEASAPAAAAAQVNGGS